MNCATGYFQCGNSLSFLMRVSIVVVLICLLGNKHGLSTHNDFAQMRYSGRLGK